jgi:dipeptidyl aminopeptidase/acylaminoacyl peptidase
VYVARIDGSDSRLLFDADAAAVYAPAARHVLFVRQGTLFAQPFDPDRAIVSGEPRPVAEQVATLGDAATVAALSASAAGPIAYRTGIGGGERQFEWVDRAGRQITTVGERDNAFQNNISLSPDGRRLAFNRLVGGNADIWLLDILRGGLTRFTTDPANDTYPIWSPDGSRIVFAARRHITVTDLYSKPTTGAGSEAPLLTTNEVKIPLDWSRDGRFILYLNVGATTGPDIWALPLDGSGGPFPLVQTKFVEKAAQFSPDGEWIAYQSDESGRNEVYIQPFHGPAARQQIYPAGGTQVRWRSDGNEVFYIAPDNRLMAVPMRFSRTARAVEADAAVPLFVTHVGPVQAFRQQYIVSADGQRFLMNSVIEEANTTPITIVLNWKPGLSR